MVGAIPLDKEASSIIILYVRKTIYSSADFQNNQTFCNFQITKVLFLYKIYFLALKYVEPNND